MVAGVLGAAALFGFHPRLQWLALILLGLGAVVMVQRPVLGLLALVLAALVGRASLAQARPWPSILPPCWRQRCSSSGC